MTYIITEPCVGTKDVSCADVCPVDCIHPAPGEEHHEESTILYIDPAECIDCDACVEACPVDAIVETRVLEYHGEKRGDLYYTKQMLLAVGDKYEAQIAADREQDAKFR